MYSTGSRTGLCYDPPGAFRNLLKSIQKPSTGTVYSTGSRTGASTGTNTGTNTPTSHRIHVTNNKTVMICYELVFVHKYVCFNN